MTPAEETLWQALRGQKLAGLKFRRQHPIGRFVLDFYCPAHNMAIEMDGSVHDEQQEQDAARTHHLSAYGCRVLRFRNDEVLTNLPSVLQRIVQATASPDPLTDLGALRGACAWVASLSEPGEGLRASALTPRLYMWIIRTMVWPRGDWGSRGQLSAD